jgi:hypothetical protein
MPQNLNFTSILTYNETDFNGTVGYTLINSGDNVYLWDESYTSNSTSLQPNLTIDTSNDKFSYIFYLDNDLEETSPTVIYDDETFWTAYTEGTGSYGITLSEETSIVKKGSSSLKMVVGSGTADSVGAIHVYASYQDWSGYEFIALWFYGTDSGETVNIEVRTSGGGNWRRWQFVDNFNGWKRIVKPLAQGDLADVGTVNLAEVDKILVIRYNIASTPTWYLDRTVVDVGQWKKIEVYVPDTLDSSVQNIQISSYKPSLGDYDSPWVKWDAEDNNPSASWGSLWLMDGTEATWGYRAYLKGTRGETKATSIRGFSPSFTYSSYYGCKYRIGFAIKMPPDDGQDSSTAGISQVKLKIEIFYDNDGLTTIIPDWVELQREGGGWGTLTNMTLNEDNDLYYALWNVTETVNYRSRSHLWNGLVVDSIPLTIYKSEGGLIIVAIAIGVVFAFTIIIVGLRKR